MNWINRTVGVVSFAFSMNAAFAQVEFSGKITDKGVPIIGASVMLSGTSCGKFTNENGEYSLKCEDVDKDTKLMVVYAGLKQAEVPLEEFSKEEVNSISVNYTSKKQFVVTR